MRGHSLSYTPAEDAWLKKNCYGHTLTEITTEFAKYFPARPKAGIKYRMYKLGLKTGNDARYKPGHVTEHAHKVGEVYRGRYGNWVRGEGSLSRKRPYEVWEAAGREIPAGCFLIHVNNDGFDDRLENLRCVNRQEHAIIARYRMHGDVSAETFDSVLAIARVRLAINKRTNVGKTLKAVAKERRCPRCGVSLRVGEYCRCK